MADEKRVMGQPQPSMSTIEEGDRQRRAREGLVRRGRDGKRKGNMAQAATMDRWFDTQLNKLYAEVVSEPLPKEILELVDKLREKKPE